VTLVLAIFTYRELCRTIIYFGAPDPSWGGVSFRGRGWRLGAVPPAGSWAEPLVKGLGGLCPPWSWNTFGFWMFNGYRKSAIFFPKIWKLKKSDFCGCFCKKRSL